MKESTTFEKHFKVSEKLYQLFMEAFEDRNPLHTDEQFAKSKGFNDRVMHGAILVGFLSNFIGECLPEKNVIVQSYKINFIKPVYLEQELSFHSTISGYFESVRSAEFRFSFVNDEFETVAKGTINIGII